MHRKIYLSLLWKKEQVRVRFSRDYLCFLGNKFRNIYYLLKIKEIRIAGKELLHSYDTELECSCSCCARGEPHAGILFDKALP